MIALYALGESYPRELARVLESTLSVVQKALTSLETDGLVAARTVGRTRIYQINPTYFASAEIRQLLKRLARPDSDLRRRLAQLRRRPRQTGKPLWR